VLHLWSLYFNSESQQRCTMCLHVPHLLPIFDSLHISVGAILMRCSLSFVGMSFITLYQTAIGLRCCSLCQVFPDFLPVSMRPQFVNSHPLQRGRRFGEGCQSCVNTCLVRLSCLLSLLPRDVCNVRDVCP